MAKQCYIPTRFNAKTLDLIEFLDKMIRQYQAAGYTLSVRQLYYQLVARGRVENTERSYKRVASIINDARLAGHLDWDAIEDRGRDVETRSHWDSGQDLLNGAAQGFHMDLWEGQENRVFVIVEKAALAGVLGGICREYDVPLLAARGYPSVSIMREMALAYIGRAIVAGHDVTVLHLGDHDPSGIDMTRDLEDRFNLFLGRHAGKMDLQRIALTMEQIEETNPPPNPAKTTDSRFQGYADIHGDESWELDALEPEYIVDLVRDRITEQIDSDAWEEREVEIETVRDKLLKVAEDFEE